MCTTAALGGSTITTSTQQHTAAPRAPACLSHAPPPPSVAPHSLQALHAIRDAVCSADAVYVLRYSHMKNAKLKEVREALGDDARLFFAANGLMAAALGRTEEDELRPGLGQLAGRLRGWCGVAAGSATKEELEAVFAEHEEPVFAKVGHSAPRDVVVPKGPLEGLAHDMEPQLRKEGLPCRLNRGVIEVRARARERERAAQVQQRLCARLAARMSPC